MLDVFGLFKVDTLYVVIGLLVITIAAIVLAIVAICKACAMTKKYEMMMEGSDGKSMEKMVRKYTDDIINLQKTSEDNTEAIKDIYEKMQLTFQKVGVNKYDAFHEMGGKLSFALCMLDKKDNGYVVNVILQYVDVMRVSDLATYNIMRAKSLVFVESSVQGLNEMFNLNEE